MLYLILSIYLIVGLAVALISLYRNRMYVYSSTSPYLIPVVLLGILVIAFTYPYFIYKREL